MCDWVWVPSADRAIWRMVPAIRYHDWARAEPFTGTPHLTIIARR